MSLNEIAADLTCEEEEFEPATTAALTEDDDNPVPGRFAFPSANRPQIQIPSGFLSSRTGPLSPRHHAHGGMLRMARAMGRIGKPVQLAVHEALLHNPDYGMLDLCRILVIR